MKSNEQSLPVKKNSFTTVGETKNSDLKVGPSGRKVNPWQDIRFRKLMDDWIVSWLASTVVILFAK